MRSFPSTRFWKPAARFSVLGLALCGAACHRAVPTKPVTDQVVVLGFDGGDPKLLAKWMAEGKLPNFSRLKDTGTFGPLGTTNPPESPVAWATFATGLNPGGTGIYDFLKRDPKTYLPELSLVSREPAKFLFGSIPIARPKVTNDRSGVPFYKMVSDAGYKATVIRMPLEFPPTNLPGGKMLAGLGTPDIRGTWGTFFYFGSELTQWDVGDTEFGGKLVRLEVNDNVANSSIEGPTDPTSETHKRISVPVDFKVTPDGNAVTINLQGHSETVQERHWSDWMRVKFHITVFLSVHAICRFYVLQVSPDLRLYMSPLNLDPENPPIAVSAPESYASDLARKYGPYKTLGWWHDTWALNEEKIDEGIFLEDLMRTDQMQADLTLDELRNDPPSLLVSVFTGTDSASHMFFRLMDPEHPRYDPELAKLYGDAILRVYEHMDQVVGEVLAAMKPSGTLIIVSDHGFHTWRRGFNTNTWLVENGYMVLKNPNEKEKSYNLDQLFGQGSFFPNVDWSKTRAYAVGLGQIYLNLRGREKEGIVDPGLEAEKLAKEIQAKLIAFKDPDNGNSVLEHVYLGKDIFHGARMSEAPELQLDFQDGYRTSWQTSLSAIPAGIVVANMKKWSGDHCASDPSDTSGIFLSNKHVSSPNPTIQDVAPTVLSLLHVAPTGQLDGRSLEFATLRAER